MFGSFMSHTINVYYIIIITLYLVSKHGLIFIPPVLNELWKFGPQVHIYPNSYVIANKFKSVSV